MDLVLSLILLGSVKREGEGRKRKFASIIRKLYGVSSGRSIIFSPAWRRYQIQSEAPPRPPEIKAAHINLRQLAAHLPDTKHLLTREQIQASRSQRRAIWRGRHCISPCQTSCQHKLCQQDGEINWREGDNESCGPKCQQTSPSAE